MSWNIIEMDVIRWSEARGIIPNSTSLAQWNKAKEELYELRESLVERDRPGIIDGLGSGNCGFFPTLEMGKSAEGIV